MDGCPNPVRMILAARRTNLSGFFLLTCTDDDGWSRRISSITSNSKYETSLTPSEPSGRQAADVDLREVGVGSAFGGGHTHLGRRGLVVELDPEAVQQVPRLRRACPHRKTAASAGRVCRGRTHPRC